MVRGGCPGRLWERWGDLCSCVVTAESVLGGSQPCASELVRACRLCLSRLPDPHPISTPTPTAYAAANWRIRSWSPVFLPSFSFPTKAVLISSLKPAPPAVRHTTLPLHRTQPNYLSLHCLHLFVPTRFTLNTTHSRPIPHTSPLSPIRVFSPGLYHARGVRRHDPHPRYNPQTGDTGAARPDA